MNLQPEIEKLKAERNHRTFPLEIQEDELLDFSSNDYLGIARRADIREEFLNTFDGDLPSFSTSSSRLLSNYQASFYKLESTLSRLYSSREALLFNSGYHANTGIIQALGSLPGTLIVADRLVHASIIDGILLSKAPFKRFRHNDMDSLESILKQESNSYKNILVVAESVYSMDGDKAPVEDFVALKQRFPNVTLYLDEAHAFGVNGPKGAGLAAASGQLEAWDIIVGTFGKAAASFGAFAVTDSTVKDYLINKSRSLIFSTMLPPIQVEWTDFIVRKMENMDREREKLKSMGLSLSEILKAFSNLKAGEGSHIQPLIIGDSSKAIALSNSMLGDGIKVMPIRRPTVPPGTERLRFSLNASMPSEAINKLEQSLRKHYAEGLYNI